MGRLTGSESRVKNVDIDRNVYHGVSHALLESVNNALHSNTIDVPGFDGVEATSHVIPHVSFSPYQWRPYPGVNRRITDPAFLVGKVEKGTYPPTSAICTLGHVAAILPWLTPL
jgi:hypothetical protein